jgi:hypothetical protein
MRRHRLRTGMILNPVDARDYLVMAFPEELQFERLHSDPGRMVQPDSVSSLESGGIGWSAIASLRRVADDPLECPLPLC